MRMRKAMYEGEEITTAGFLCGCCRKSQIIDGSKKSKRVMYYWYCVSGVHSVAIL